MKKSRLGRTSDKCMFQPSVESKLSRDLASQDLDISSNRDGTTFCIVCSSILTLIFLIPSPNFPLSNFHPLPSELPQFILVEGVSQFSL